MLVDDVATRLQAQVPTLAQRTRGALDLAELLRKNALPNYTPAAFVVPLGLIGRTAESSENAFLQLLEEQVSVVLVQRTAGDVDGSRGQAPLQSLVWQVVFALAGWEAVPDSDEEASGSDAIGVLELRRGRVLQLNAGTVFYQLDFGIPQQLRVLT